MILFVVFFFCASLDVQYGLGFCVTASSLTLLCCTQSSLLRDTSSRTMQPWFSFYFLLPRGCSTLHDAPPPSEASTETETHAPRVFSPNLNNETAVRYYCTTDQKTKTKSVRCTGTRRVLLELLLYSRTTKCWRLLLLLSPH